LSENTLHERNIAGPGGKEDGEIDFFGTFGALDDHFGRRVGRGGDSPPETARASRAPRGATSCRIAAYGI
jgi:hypothetical protein